MPQQLILVQPSCDPGWSPGVRRWRCKTGEIGVFPKPIYGNTIIVYTVYLYEIEVGAKRTTVSGGGTEMFVRRGNDLVNVGWNLDSGK